jgi:hypothetical protein
MLRTLALDRPHPDLDAALAHHGYVQMDPINVCGRMHDLILRNRVKGYREGDLQRHAHGTNGPIAAGEVRRSFEHYVPQRGVLATYPIEAWPFVRGFIGRRALRRGVFGKALRGRNAGIARRILDEIRDRGPLTSDDIEHDERSHSDWGMPGRLVKNLLEVLFAQGAVLISRRQNFRRVYDLAERVIAGESVPGPEAGPDASELHRWRVLLELRQRRLVRLGPKDLARVREWVQPVRVDNAATYYCLRSDLDVLDAVGRVDVGEPRRTLLLAPLDPLIYDRSITRRVWDFDYTWEVYTPAAKRMRGYYVLPVLHGTSIAGHVEPRVDRAAERIRVVSRKIRRGVPLAHAVAELGTTLGLGSSGRSQRRKNAVRG